MSAIKHVVSVKQFQDKSLLKQLFGRADYFSSLSPVDYPKPLKHHTIATLFYEPSTRTRLSFEAAIQNLGASLISTENAGSFSSAIKGESLEDSILTINAYTDAIVLRHPEIGAADKAAMISKASIFNAGDGAGEHPTQALLDLYTIQRQKGVLDGLKIALVGDLKNGRTIHSLLQLLVMYDIELFCIAPKVLQLPSKYKNIIKKSGVSCTYINNWDEVMGKLDVLYMTRVQKERFATPKEYEAVKNSFILDTPAMKTFNPSGIVMHPLPRVNEIETDVDSDPRAIYFSQVRNGLYLRMALLELILAD